MYLRILHVSSEAEVEERWHGILQRLQTADEHVFLHRKIKNNLPET
jgi:hypothetical protein